VYNTLNNEKLLTLKDLERRWQIKRTTLCVLKNRPEFPSPVIFPGMGPARGKRWRLADIEAYEEKSASAEK
jgi:predicted DNA-binding transcriptional regulator AlpA